MPARKNPSAANDKFRQDALACAQAAIDKKGIEPVLLDLTQAGSYTDYLLVASAQFVMGTLGVHMGFTFSQGAIDFVVFNVLSPYSQKWWLVLILGPIYAGLYFATFTAMIRWRKLKTPGREDAPATALPAAAMPVGKKETSLGLVLAFGGRGNIAALDACITRLRVTVKDPAQVDEARLKQRLFLETVHEVVRAEGRAEGLTQGLAEGLAKGRVEGLDQGLAALLTDLDQRAGGGVERSGPADRA